MVLTMDIGNTNVKLGLFDGDALVCSWRISTKAYRTADEYGMSLFDLLAQKGYKFEDVTAVVMSSVAPALNYTIEHTCDYYLHLKPLTVSCHTDAGIAIDYDHPEELGADRIVGSAGAYHFYGQKEGKPVIVVDFGSATTFNLVSRDGVFLGGAIAPGIMTATESLVTTAAKLPRIELSPPENIVGKNTRDGMRSGIIYGYAGLVKYMLEKYRELDDMKDAIVVATGGLSELVANAEQNLFDIVDRALALNSLKYIYDRNA